MMLDDFGNAIRDIRLSRNILLYDMAKDLGISSSELSSIECGKKPIPNWFVQKLQERYGISNIRVCTLYNFIKKRGECQLSNVDKKNAEGYSDPTAYAALKHISDEDARFHKLLHMLFDICELSGFEIEGRIVLVDKQTGKVWR